METVADQPALKNKPETGPAIVIEHLYKSFGKNKVLNDLNLIIPREKNIVVLGKSGSGKSVLIKCIIFMFLVKMYLN
jgi:ABC-type transporter Mla maintaining outer membrane lipid asymmetry ATPase subunit MlaF